MNSYSPIRSRQAWTAGATGGRVELDMAFPAARGQILKPVIIRPAVPVVHFQPASTRANCAPVVVAGEHRQP